MIGIIEIDEKDVSDDRHIILELPIEPGRNGTQTVMRVKTNIKLQPEIIRCKDCKNWDTNGNWADDGYYCPNVDGIRESDFYCADAERRTDGSD